MSYRKVWDCTFILLLLSGLCIVPLTAQQSVFERQILQNAVRVEMDVAANNDFIVTAQYNTGSGNPWESQMYRFDADGNFLNTWPTVQAQFTQVLEQSNGDIIVQAFPNGSNTVWLYKYSGTSILWGRYYVPTPPADPYIVFRDYVPLKEMPNGNLAMVIVEQRNLQSIFDSYVLIIDGQSGNVLHSEKYNDVLVRDLDVDGSNNLIMSVQFPQSDLYGIIRADPQGLITWARELDPGQAIAAAANMPVVINVLDNGNGYLLAGSLDPLSEMFAARVSETGVLEWSNHYRFPTTAFRMQSITSQGSLAYLMGDANNVGNIHPHLVCLDITDGDVVWNNGYDPGGNTAISYSLAIHDQTAIALMNGNFNLVKADISNGNTGCPPNQAAIFATPQGSLSPENVVHQLYSIGGWFLSLTFTHPPFPHVTAQPGCAGNINALSSLPFEEEVDNAWNSPNFDMDISAFDDILFAGGEVNPNYHIGPGSGILQLNRFTGNGDHVASGPAIEPDYNVTSVEELNDGRVVVAGYREGGFAFCSVLDANGNPLWITEYNFNGFPIWNYMPFKGIPRARELPNGNLAFVFREEDQFTSDHRMIVAILDDLTGSVFLAYALETMVPQSLDIDDNGNLAIAGYRFVQNGNFVQPFALGMTTGGGRLWSIGIDNPYFSMLCDIHALGQGRGYAVLANIEGQLTSVWRLDANGNPLWADEYLRFDGNSMRGRAITEDGQGTIIIGGEAGLNGQSQPFMAAIPTDPPVPSHPPLWVKVYDGNSNWLHGALTDVEIFTTNPGLVLGYGDVKSLTTLDTEIGLVKVSVANGETGCEHQVLADADPIALDPFIQDIISIDLQPEEVAYEASEYPIDWYFHCTGMPKRSAAREEAPAPVNGLALYPNPLEGTELTLAFAGNGGLVRIAVRDLLGRVVYRRSLQTDKNEQQIKLDDMHLAPGMYSLEVSGGEGVQSARFMVR